MKWLLLAFPVYLIIEGKFVSYLKLAASPAASHSTSSQPSTSNILNISGLTSPTGSTTP